MKPIPRDSGSFLAIRTAGQLYVDKTAYFHELVTAPDAKCFFLARPRRFGKSLMITTLKEIFNGRRDLFEDLAIAKTDYAWKKHPVLHFNFAKCANATSYENFENSFCRRVEAALKEVGCAYDRTCAPGENFGAAIDALAARDPKAMPVILVADHPCGTYIFELKVDQPPALAMSQAERKDYAAPYVAANKPIWLVGLSFARETRKFLAGTAERYCLGESSDTGYCHRVQR